MLYFTKVFSAKDQQVKVAVAVLTLKIVDVSTVCLLRYLPEKQNKKSILFKKLVSLGSLMSLF